MPHRDVTYGPGNLGAFEAGTPTVYLREHWGDPWIAYSEILPTEVRWSGSAAIPYCRFTWKYGRVKHPSQAAHAGTPKLNDVQRWGVKVECPMVRDEAGQWVNRNWHGVIDVNADRLDGLPANDPNRPRGANDFVAYGWEHVLAKDEIDASFWWQALAPGPAVRTVDCPLVFNLRGMKNRTGAKHGGSYVFECDPDDADAAHWRTVDIVEYLLANTRVAAGAGDNVPFQIAAGAFIPSFDHEQEVRQDRQTILSLINSLVNRQRLLQPRFVVDEVANVVELHVETDTEVPIPLPEMGPGIEIPANGETRDLIFDTDQLTRGVHVEKSTEVYDQVQVRGAKRRSIGTFSFLDANLGKGWTASHATAYDEGASTTAGYAALDAAGKIKEMRVRNIEARGRPNLESVYALFTIPKNWVGKTVDGLPGGPLNLLFPGLDGQVPCWAHMVVEQTLAFLEGVEYDGNKVPDQTFDESLSITKNETPPIVIFKKADTDTWIRAEDVGLLAEPVTNQHEPRVTISVSVPPNRQGILIKASPRHAIAETDFVPLPVDKPDGTLDYQGGNMVVTLSIQDQRFAQAVHPDPLAGDIDYPKIKTIYAGNKYRQVYVAPGTTVDVDQSGALVFSDGGYLHDETDQLKTIARIAAAYYTQPHHVLNVSGQRMKAPADVELGNLVRNFGAVGGHRRTINAIISEIALSYQWGTAQPGGGPAPEMQIVTSAGELDALQFAPNVHPPEIPKKKRPVPRL